MKKLILFSITVLAVSSCKTTIYLGSVGQQHQTQVILSNSNFKVLGSFLGTATYSKQQVSIKEKEGIISLAKADFLSKAKAGGAELIGSRAIVNVVTDVVENENRITVTYCGEVIEFLR